MVDWKGFYDVQRNDEKKATAHTGGVYFDPEKNQIEMQVDTDSFACKELPVFIDGTEILMKWIQSLSYEEKKLWTYNDKITRQNAERFAR